LETFAWKEYELTVNTTFGKMLSVVEFNDRFDIYNNCQNTACSAADVVQ